MQLQEHAGPSSVSDSIMRTTARSQIDDSARQQKQNLMQNRRYPINRHRLPASAYPMRLHRFANGEPGSSDRVDSEPDFCAAMAGFAATVAVAQGNAPDPYLVTVFVVSWDQNRGLWHVLDSDGIVRSYVRCQSAA